MTYVTETERWNAILSRDRNAEGAFWLGVLTTGVFCRPGCPARTPLRKNVAFFDSLQDALRSGLRPCKRCRPLGKSIEQENVDVITAACRSILQGETEGSLAELAARAGMSEGHFQKLFSTVVGVSPAQFGLTVKTRRLQQALPLSDSVTDAAYDAGFRSSSQFYEAANDSLGMTPTAFRNRGQGETIRWTVAPTFLGNMLIAATDRGICRIALADDVKELETLLESEFANATLLPPDEAFRKLVEQTVESIGTPAAAALPVDIRGTAFQAKVWQTLRRIPFGTTVTYSDVAEEIGQPTAVRAVATACANNNVAIVIPCHRVIGKDGKLTGYRWGIERKQALLKREAEAAR